MAVTYCGELGSASSAPTTSTAPAARAACECAAIAPHTTTGVGRVPMIRSIASMPPLAGSRSSRTAPGLCSTTAASASAAVQTSAATTKPGADSRLRSVRVRVRLSPTTTTTRGGAVSPVPGMVAPGC